MPKGVSWPHTFGSVLLALIVVQVVTGLLLSFYYSPNSDAAYESVQYIEQEVAFGSLIRGVHHFAASAMVVMLFFHIARTFFYGAYKQPRQWTWIYGVTLLIVVLGFAFTGYLLPWDMKAYFATKVGINIGGLIPVVGAYLVKVLQGGREMGTTTLSRFYSLHVILLPLVLVFCVGLHLYYIRLHGETPPGLRNDDKIGFAGTFYPAQLFRDSLVVFLVIAVVFGLAAAFGAPLEAKADPNDTTYLPRPDWYFYGLFQLLKLLLGNLEVVGAIILPGVLVAILILLPFLDKNPERRLSKRPGVLAGGSAAILVIVLLTALGGYEGRVAANAAATPDLVTVEGEIEDTFVVDPRMGRRLYVELKCGECHGHGSAGKNIPPGLEFAGNKYKYSWLGEYLMEPHRVRWQTRGLRPVARMPDFKLSEEEALNLTSYLMALRVDTKLPELGFDWAAADSDMVESGAELAFEYGCLGCHRVGEQGQDIGPGLSNVGSKLQDSYLFHIVQAPDKLIPGTGMKNFQLDLDEIEELVAYLRTLR